MAFALAGQIVTNAAQAERIGRAAREIGRDWLIPQCESVARRLRAQEEGAQPTVVAIDDWMVFARTANGRIVQACAEMWPEWLDFAKDPSDMDPDEYRGAVLQILRTKRPLWTDFENWMIDGEIEDARSRGETMTREQARVELADFLDLSPLISQQAAFFARATGEAQS